MTTEREGWAERAMRKAFNDNGKRRNLAFQYSRAKVARGQAIGRGDWSAAYGYTRDMLEARRLRRQFLAF